MFKESLSTRISVIDENNQGISKEYLSDLEEGFSSIIVFLRNELYIGNGLY